MQYRRLGSSDLEVSVISLGSWLTYGVTVERSQTSRCIRRAFEHGINFFDTANMYGRGATESLLGELLSAYPRDDYLLSTKVYFPMSATDRGLSRMQIHRQIDASLKRLRTDHVDLYQCHRYDKDTPLEETMEAMTEVVKAGKARYIGFSQWSPRQIKAAHKLENVVPLVSSSPQYSMLHRKPERRVIPLCNELGIGQIVWSPLAQGVLSGKYKPGAAPPRGSRAGDNRISRKMRRFTDERVLEAVQRLRPIAEQLSVSISQLALAWVLRKDCVSSAIVGAIRPEQVEENAGAADIRIDDATGRAIDQALADVL